MSKSKIEWTTDTWNPVTGCTKVSPGCANCYALRMAKRLRGRHGYPADDPFRVTLRPDRLDQPAHWQKSRMIFVCSMSDLFHASVPSEFIRRVFDTIAVCPQHTFQVLTKRPARMVAELQEMPTLDNVWLGYSAEDERRYRERSAEMDSFYWPMRFLSAEPLLGPIDLLGPDGALDWVIAGGESGPGARDADLDWYRLLLTRCREAGVPYFQKQICHGGRKIPYDDWPSDLRVREWPKGRAVSLGAW